MLIPIKDVPNCGVITHGNIKWTVIAREAKSIMCISNAVIEKRIYHSDSVNFQESLLYQWLNGDFLFSLFSDTTNNITNIISATYNPYNANDEYVGYMQLLTVDQYTRLKPNIPLINKWWWTSTPSEPNNYSLPLVYCIDNLGGVSKTFPLCTDIFVRPVCCIYNDVLVEYNEQEDNEENDAAAVVPTSLSSAEKLDVIKDELIDALEEKILCDRSVENLEKCISLYKKLVSFCILKERS